MMARIRQQMAKEDKGFTLIELLVVMIIIGILAAIAIPVFLNQRKKAEDSAAKADVSTVGKEIATYFVDWDGKTAAPIAQDTTNNKYTMSGESIGNSSKNVVLHVTKVDDDQDWCVYVTNDKGDKAKTGFQYSAEGGLEEGTCA